MEDLLDLEMGKVRDLVKERGLGKDLVKERGLAVLLAVKFRGEELHCETSTIKLPLCIVIDPIFKTNPITLLPNDILFGIIYEKLYT